MTNTKTAKELAKYYRDMSRKGIEELPLDNIIVEKCKVRKTGNEIDTDGKIDIKCTTYNCTFNGITYPFSASCNQELLEFVESIVEKDSYWKNIYLRDAVGELND